MLDSIYIFNLLCIELDCLNCWSDDCYLPYFGNSISGCDICFELMKVFLIIASSVCLSYCFKNQKQ